MVRLPGQGRKGIGWKWERKGKGGKGGEGRDFRGGLLIFNSDPDTYTHLRRNLPPSLKDGFYDFSRSNLR